MEVSQIACNTKYINQSIKIEQCNANLNIIELRKQRKNKNNLHLREFSNVMYEGLRKTYHRHCVLLVPKEFQLYAIVGHNISMSCN
jgi:hypothetical protein